jgi:hypothetical protein
MAIRRLCSLIALAVLVLSASASTPATSSITVPTTAGVTVSDTWTGTAGIGTNPNSDCTVIGTSPVDEHDVTVNVPAGTYSTVNAAFTFQINWTPASPAPTTSDLILTVVRPDGTVLDSSDGSDPKETVSASNLSAGTYKVLVCGYVNAASQPYNGSLQISTSAVTTSPPPQFLASANKKWGAPVKVTPTNGYGYEPSFIVDKYGNAFATAHKENAFLALSLDANSPTATRSMSWAWLSIDNGQTWTDPPGLTALSLEQHQVGDEGDMAQDDAGHIYYVDTYAADVTFTRWTTNGLGQVIFDYSRPILPSPETDDRPWTIAHGDGHVFYFSNLGRKDINGGRYTVHASYDGGITWDYVGIPLPDSGWCRPAADHRPGSQLVYVACTNDAGKLYSYVSTDDGHSWNRYDMGTYNNGDDTQSWPTIQVGPDGTVWVLYVDGFDTQPSTDATGAVTNYPTHNNLYLFKSTNQGKTWTKQDITPVYGRYQYAWLSMTADGKKLGMGVYFRSNNGSSYPWYAAGAVWGVGSKPGAKDLLSLDPDHPASSGDHLNAPGDYMGSYFFPDGKLGAIWTRYVLWTDAATLTRDIYFARQR